MKYTRSYMILSSIFIASLLTSNIIAVKIVDIFGLNLPASIVVFPISYVIEDVVAEIYGFRRARQMILLGFFGNLLAVLFITIAISLPSAPFWGDQSKFIDILGSSWRILLASFTAFLVGSISNAWVMSKMKVLTKGRFLWLRTTASTVVGEGLDTLIFILLAFSIVFQQKDLYSMMLTQWVFKIGYEVMITPVTYFVVGLLKKNGEQVIDEH